MRASFVLSGWLLSACGGVPQLGTIASAGDGTTRTTGPYGWLPTPAVDATIWPREVDAAERLLRETVPALLRPARGLAEAWEKAWQQWTDLAAEPAVPGAPGRTLWGRWGLAPERPVRVVLTGVDGTRAGRSLLRVLEAFQQVTEVGAEAVQVAVDEALESAPIADVQVRLLVETTAPERLTEALRFHLERRAFDVYEIGEAPPLFARGLPLPPDTVLVAHSTPRGHLLLLRGTSKWRALDWVSAVSPRVPVAALLRRAVITDATAPPTGADSRLTIHLPGVALLELALATSAALRALEVPAAASSRTEMLLAATHLAAACSDRWRRLARLAFSASLTWRAGGDVVLDAAFSPRAVDALSRAKGPMFLDSSAWRAKPLSAYARFRRASFLEALPELADLPTSPFVLWDEASVCAGGHPLTALATVAVALPATDIAEWVPAPIPGDLTLLGANPWFVGAAVFASAVPDGASGPQIGLAAVAQASDFPRDATPLGETAQLQVTPSGPRFILGAGADTLAYERRPLGDGREAGFLAFGDAALPTLLEAVAATGADGPLAALTLDAVGLTGARGLIEDPELQAVLALWAARRLAFHVDVSLQDARLTYRLSAGRNLEPRP